MQFQSFEVRPHNSHYEGAYSSRELQWRRICAVDKVGNLEALVGNNAVETVLEVGCGTGAVLAEVARKHIGRSHMGIDVADPGVHTDEAAVRLRLLEYDGEAIPFPAKSFDLVYSSHVIEHVPDPRSLLREIGRVSKRLIYVEVPCELHARTNHRDLQATLNIGHINAFTPESFLILLQTAGLTIVEAQLFDHSFDAHRFHTSFFSGTLKGLVRRTALAASPLFASRIFTYHFGVLCTPQ